MVKAKNFNETDIFRSTVILFKNCYEKVKNMQTDVKIDIGHNLLQCIRNCGEYAKLSYIECKENKRLKLKYMILANKEISKAEFDLNLIVSCCLFPGKIKHNESQEVYINGGSEISKNIGELKIQINDFISSLKDKLTKEEIDNIYFSLL